MTLTIEQQITFEREEQRRIMKVNENQTSSGSRSGSLKTQELESDQTSKSWDGSTVHVESAIAATNPCREENIRTIASRLARFNAMETSRDALVAALVDLVHQLPTDERLADFNLDQAEAALALANGQDNNTSVSDGTTVQDSTEE